MVVGLKTANRNVAKLERKVNILEVEKRERKAGKSTVLCRLQSNTCRAQYFKSCALIPDPNCLETYRFFVSAINSKFINMVTRSNCTKIAVI